MIRPFTCICLAMALGSGLYLYQTKHRALLLDRDIAHVLAAADAARARIGLLRAEYALQNDPSRLADLSAQWLPSLKNTAPGQFSTLADLDRRLPPVGLPPEAVEPEPVVVPEPVLAEAPPPATLAEPARPAVESARPTIAAVSRPVPLVPSANAAPMSPPMASPAVAARIAAATPAPITPLPRPAPRPVAAPPAPPAAAPPRSVMASVTPPPGSPSFNAPSAVASSTGGGPTNAPPFNAPAGRMYTPVAAYSRPPAPPPVYASRPAELGNPVGSSLGMARGTSAQPSFFANASDGNR